MIVALGRSQCIKLHVRQEGYKSGSDECLANVLCTYQRNSRKAACIHAPKMIHEALFNWAAELVNEGRSHGDKRARKTAGGMLQF